MIKDTKTEKKKNVPSFKNVRSSVGFPGDSVVKKLPANAEDAGSIPGLGKSPREGNGNPL